MSIECPKCKEAFEPKQPRCQECLETCMVCGTAFDPYLTCWEEDSEPQVITNPLRLDVSAPRPSEQALDPNLDTFRSINKHKHSYPEMDEFYADQIPDEVA